MGNPYPCYECQSIARDFEAACEAIESSSSLSDESRAAYEALLVIVRGKEPRLSEESRAAHDALRRMIGGTEEDAERAEEILIPYQHRTQGLELFCNGAQWRHPKLFDVIRRMALHQGRTGHMPLAGI